MVLYRNISNTINILVIATLTTMGSGCVGSSDEVAASKEVNLIELPARIQRSTVLNSGVEGLKACVRVREEGVTNESTCRAMEFVGTKAKLTIPDLKSNTNYVVSIEFSFISETYGNVLLATVEKTTTTVTGTNQLSFVDDLYQYPDADKDGWDNHRELERGTDPYVVDTMTRTSLLGVGNVDCLNGGSLRETGIDKNANEVLDDNEVNARENICDDAPTESAAWKGAVSIENSNSGNAWQAQVAVDNSGSAVAVWQEHDGTRYNIWANRLTPETGWGTATLIETNNVGDAVSPQVVLDSDGNALVVWQQDDGVRKNIWANRFVLGTGWSSATLIESDNVGDAVSPQLGMDGSGNAIAVWQQYDGSLESIWANRFDLNTGWGEASLIESDTTGDAWVPQVAVDSTGNAVAVWTQWRDGSLKIWANRFAPNTGWSGAELIGTAGAGRSDYPQVAVDDNGNAVVVWQQRGDTRNNIWANIFLQDSGWGVAQLIETESAGDAWSPQVSTDSEGNVVAVWYQSDGTQYNIWANHFVPYQGWGVATLIEIDDTGDAKSPQVAVGSNGNAVAVWVQMDGARNNVWANRFVKGTGWGTAELIETDNYGGAWGPQVVVESNGNAMAVWSQLGEGNTFFDIFANRFQTQTQ